MKSFFILIILLSAITCLKAQTIPATRVQRVIRFHTIGKDSIDLNFNEDYDMIEDSCAVIVRHAHINMRERKFFGKFTDISKLDPSVVLSEGTYTTDGLKTGLFVSRYLNGNLKSKGAYKNDKFDGRWETYYEDTKPALIFEAANDSIRIINAWGTDGKKIIDNGNGTYASNLGSITWKGKLDNGIPNGTWHAYKTDDATQTSLAEESFKKGKFQKGNSPLKINYTDVSRILLINPETLPFARAEKLRISAIPCNGLKRKHLVNAQFRDGMSSFTLYVTDAVRPVFSTVDLRLYQGTLILEGDVSEQGIIENLKPSNAFNTGLAQAIIREMRKLPLLQPASADGKPVKQGFTINFTFTNGLYTLSYRFLPIK